MIQFVYWHFLIRNEVNQRKKDHPKDGKNLFQNEKFKEILDYHSQTKPGFKSDKLFIGVIADINFVFIPKGYRRSSSKH
jgi:hypothetical protein